MSKLDTAQRMLDWLVQGGGYVHPSVIVKDDPERGLGLHATATIAAEERLISSPFSLAITAEVATEAITALLALSADDLVHDGKPWSERMRQAAYVSLHWIYGEKGGEWPSELKHRPYVDALPESVTTPLYFTEAERSLLAGTNLAGAIQSQEADWKAEHAAVAAKVEGVTWERYLAVATYLSSRAFPSRLLRITDSSVSEDKEAEVNTDDSYPVLLPGLDMLNHARGQPITWLSARIPTSEAAVSFISPGQEAGEVFNNYGAKSNESLLLAYGFVIPSNPDDTVVLQLGGVPESMAAQLKAKGLDATRRFEVGRDGEMPQDLVRTLRIMMADSGCSCCGSNSEDHEGHDHEGHSHGHSHGDEEEDEEEEWDEHAAHEKEVGELELELDVLGMLGGLLEDKLSRVEAEPEPQGAGEVREQVKEMVDIYRAGQVDILNAALDKLGERVDRVESLLAEGPECPCGC